MQETPSSHLVACISELRRDIADEKAVLATLADANSPAGLTAKANIVWSKVMIADFYQQLERQ